MDILQRYKERLIAAAVTAFSAVAIVLVLIFAVLRYNADKIQDQTPPPEVVAMEEERFIIPEIIDTRHDGQDQTTTAEASQQRDESPAAGMPDPSPVPQPQARPKSTNPDPNAPKRDTPLTQQTPSPVKTTPAPTSTEDEKRLAALTGMKNANNGSPTSKKESSEGEKQGDVNASGSVNGRKMLSCPSRPTQIKSPVAVVVRITVGADGTVKSAKASSGPAAYRSLCEGWARASRWTPREGAPDASGSITFSIKP